VARQPQHRQADERAGGRQPESRRKQAAQQQAAASTRRADTQAAARQPYCSSTSRMTMLASPGFTPGMGLGIAASASVRPIASAASRAMRRSSAVTGNSIAERVIGGGAAADFEADLIRQAQRRLAGLGEPALFHAQLARRRVGRDTGAAGLDLDPRGAERAVDGEGLRVGEGERFAPPGRRRG
jgi:hypothetical protein